MDLSKINNLTIIKKNKDPLVSNSIPSNGYLEAPSGLGKPPLIIDKKTILFDLYKEFRYGKLSKYDFDKKLQATENKLIENLTAEVRNEILLVLSHTLKWLIQLKLLFSTGRNSENLNSKIFDEQYSEYNELSLDNIKELIINIVSITEDDLNINIISKNPKEFSLGIKNFLNIFLKDDILNPKYKTDKIINYLHNERPTFLKEIAVLFDLYSKYYNTLSKKLLEDLGNGDFNIKFDKIKNIQPRFNMINKHILSSNLDTKINFDIDLKKIGVLPEDPLEATNILGISASQFSLKKRLDNLNSWLTNGILMVQVSINRLHALKPLSSIAVDGSVKVGLKSHAAQSANQIYDIWLILEDTKSFLESLKGLIDGSAFLTGVSSEDQLQILDTNY